MSQTRTFTLALLITSVVWAVFVAWHLKARLDMVETKAMAASDCLIKGFVSEICAQISDAGQSVRADMPNVMRRHLLVGLSGPLAAAALYVLVKFLRPSRKG